MFGVTQCNSSKNRSHFASFKDWFWGSRLDFVWVIRLFVTQNAIFMCVFVYFSALSATVQDQVKSKLDARGDSVI